MLRTTFLDAVEVARQHLVVRDVTAPAARDAGSSRRASSRYRARRSDVPPAPLRRRRSRWRDRQRRRRRSPDRSVRPPSITEPATGGTSDTAVPGKPAETDDPPAVRKRPAPSRGAALWTSATSVSSKNISEVDMTGATRQRADPARRDHLKRRREQRLIAGERLFDVTLRRRERRRIDDDQIPGALRRCAASRNWNTSLADVWCCDSGRPLSAQFRLRLFDRGLGKIDAGYLRRSVRARVDRKSAGVREQVQHRSAPRAVRRCVRGCRADRRRTRSSALQPGSPGIANRSRRTAPARSAHRRALRGHASWRRNGI